jgi:4-hydroxybenzoate polyprenyltransferase
MSADRTTGFTDIDQQHWSLRYLPAWMRPYGRLARWDRPIGIWLLLFPCWWSVALAAAPHWGNMVGWMALFAVGAIAMRGAGCTWNDIVDARSCRAHARSAVALGRTRCAMRSAGWL